MFFHPINNKLGGDKECGITTWSELKSLTDTLVETIKKNQHYVLESLGKIS